MDNLKNDKYYIDLARKDIEKIIQYTKGISYEDFINDEQLIDAVMFRLVQMIENIKKITNEFKNKHKDIEWNEIIGFRNRIVHDYGKTDYTVVYEIISDDIQKLQDIFK